MKKMQIFSLVALVNAGAACLSAPAWAELPPIPHSVEPSQSATAVQFRAQAWLKNANPDEARYIQSYLEANKRNNIVAEILAGEQAEGSVDAGRHGDGDGHNGDGHNGDGEGHNGEGHNGDGHNGDGDGHDGGCGDGHGPGHGHGHGHEVSCH